MKKLLIFCLTLVLCLSQISFSGMIVENMSSVDNTVKLIKLTKDNFTDENIYKYHDTHLINKMSVLGDDQDKIVDVNALPSNKVMNDNVWKPNFASEVKGARGIIDLKQNYVITNIIAYDTNGNADVVIESGKPFKWEYETNLHLYSYKNFITLDVNIATRYLHLVCLDNATSLAEIYLFGYLNNANVEPPYEQPAKDKPITTVDKALGVNAFVDDPLRVSKIGGHIREFHNISFTYNGKNYFNPSANNAWNFDDYYKSLYDRGIDPVPCIQGTHTSISGDNIVDYSGNEKPIPEGADPLSPASYAQHSSVMFNYAARYGSNFVDANRLNLGDNQKPLTGLGYIQYFENFNEPNKDWEGEKSYLSPYEMAAMCSADYDGHERALGNNYGVKNADKNSKLVMGGLVGRNVIEYVNLMKLWFENNRQDKQFAVDVINLHYYIKTSAPENTSMRKDLQNIVDYVKTNLPGVEVWVTEYGPEISTEEISDKFSDEYYEAKGFGTVRMFLEGMAAGVDRMTMFMLRDTDSGVYSTDGLTTHKGQWYAKPSWHYLFGTKTALKDCVFDSIIKEDDVYIYKFKANNRDVYAMWLPTIGKESKEISFNTGEKKSAQITKLEDFYAEGLTEKLTIQNASVTVKLTARPIFVSLYDELEVKIAPTKVLLDIQNITGASNTLPKIKVMFNEQYKAPITPSARLRAEFNNYALDQEYIDAKPNIPENRVYPMEAVIDFGRDVVVTDIGYYDSNNSGDIIVYALDNMGCWQKIDNYGLNKYNEWVVNESQKQVSTRYIKVAKYNEAACYEMAFFGYQNANRIAP